jgi:hypothetical protein
MRVLRCPHGALHLSDLISNLYEGFAEGEGHADGGVEGEADEGEEGPGREEEEFARTIAEGRDGFGEGIDLGFGECFVQMDSGGQQLDLGLEPFVEVIQFLRSY